MTNPSDALDKPLSDRPSSPTSLRWIYLFGFLVSLPLLYVFLAAEKYQDYRQTHKDRLAHDLQFRQFTVKPDKVQNTSNKSALCNSWSIQAVLFPNDTTKHTVAFSPYEHNRDIVLAQWNPEGPFPVPVYFPYGVECANGKTATAAQLSEPVTKSPDTLLCTHDGGPETDAAPRRTVAVKISSDPKAYRALLAVDSDDRNMMDVWGFHSQFLSQLVAMYVSDVSVVHFNMTADPVKLGFKNVATGTVPQSTLYPPVDVVLLLPDEAWPLVNGNDRSTKTPFKADPVSLASLAGNGTDMRALSALQAIADGLEGQVLVVAHGTSTELVQAALRGAGMEPRAKVWVEPVYGDLLKSIETKNDLVPEDYEDPTGMACFGSVIHQYALTFLRVGVPPGPRVATIARHVCFTARQNTSLHSEAPALNLRSDVFHNLVKRMSSPIVLHPRLSLREVSDTAANATDLGNTSVRDGVPSDGSKHSTSDGDDSPLLLDRSTLSGQMRFVNEECAVLVGARGPTLAHALALRPTAHVIELYSSDPTPTIRNIAALVHNVSYTAFKMDAVKKGKLEGDLVASDEEMEQLVALIKLKLRNSVTMQMRLQTVFPQPQ